MLLKYNEEEANGLGHRTGLVLMDALGRLSGFFIAWRKGVALVLAKLCDCFDTYFLPEEGKINR